MYNLNDKVTVKGQDGVFTIKTITIQRTGITYCVRGNDKFLNNIPTKELELHKVNKIRKQCDIVKNKMTSIKARAKRRTKLYEKYLSHDYDHKTRIVAKMALSDIEFILK